MRAVAFALALALALCGAALAKTFDPGEVRLCGTDGCVAIEDRAVLDAFTRFYFGTPGPSRVRAPRPGTPALHVELGPFRGVSSIVGGPNLDRMLVNGVNCSRFMRRGRWYRLPPAARAEVRRLAAGLARARVPRNWRHRC